MAQDESFDYSSITSEEDIDRIFSSVEAEIQILFNHLLESIITRKNKLLEKLNQIRFEYEDKVRVRREEMDELLAMKYRIQQGNDRSSLVRSHGVKRLFLDKIEVEVGQFSYLFPAVPVFNCEYNGLLAKIEELGCVVDVGNMYTSKNRPHTLIGTRGSGKKELNNPRSIYLYEKRNQLFVVDAGNRRIKILALSNLEFKYEFGRKYLKSPMGRCCMEKIHFRNRSISESSFEVQFILFPSHFPSQLHTR